MATNADPADAERELSGTAPTAGSSALVDDNDPTAANAAAAVGDAQHDDPVVGDAGDPGTTHGALGKRPMPHVRLATMIGLAVIVALAATVGWLGFRAYQSDQAQAQRQLLVQTARQCALNLTTIDWQHADTDVQRLVDSATGQFYEQFAARKQPFIDVVKKAQSKSVGTITEAGLESESGNEAQVLVAVSIKTSNLVGAEQPPREWRIRISVEKSGDSAKVSNVTFVP